VKWEARGRIVQEYKEPSDDKLTLGPLAIVTLEVAFFNAYAQSPTLLPFLKCILEVVFCDGVQHHLQFCLGCVMSKWLHFRLVFNWGNQ
jgi:hypothetical protein